jgi:IclR family transcriptional regulator, acetate operon repressor
MTAGKAGLQKDAHLSRPIAHSDTRPTFQVLERTFGILEVFTESQPEWSTTQVARELDLPVPTVHRILAALKRLGYVSQHEESRRFRLGMAALSLGERASTLADIRPVAIGPLRRLSDSTAETALLTVLSPARDRSVCLDRVETSQPLRLSVQPGRQLPLHAGASQKALLAFMPADEIDRFTAQPLERFCTATITSRPALRRELTAIRARGWSSSFEETNVGVWGIAVPVLSGADVVCAVGIAGPSPRLTVERVRRDVRLTHEAATVIGRALGLTAPPVTLSDARVGPAGKAGAGPRDRSSR